MKLNKFLFNDVICDYTSCTDVTSFNNPSWTKYELFKRFWQDFFVEVFFLIGLKMLNLMIQFLNLFEKLRREKKLSYRRLKPKSKEKQIISFVYIFFPREIKSTKKDRDELDWRRLLFVKQQKRQWKRRWMKNEWERKIRIKWKLCRSASEQKAKPIFCFVRSSILVVVNTLNTLWMNS